FRGMLAPLGIYRMLLLCGWALSACLLEAEEPAGALDVGDRKQLFIDKRFIVTSEGVTLRMNPAQKLGLILDESGQPSPENGHISRVIDDNGRVRLYVGAGDVFILESEDGMRFKRIDTKIGRGELPTIFLDKHDPDPARRYKLFWLRTHMPFDPKTDGIFAGYSADGLEFTTVGRVLPFLIDN